MRTKSITEPFRLTVIAAGAGVHLRCLLAAPHGDHTMALTAATAKTMAKFLL